MKFSKKLLLLCCLTLVFFTGQGQAEPLRVATLDYPPYQYQEDGEIKGLAATLIQEIFRRMDQPIEITFYPFPRALRNIQEGKSDVIFTFYHKEEREAFAEYSKESLVDQTISLFVPQDSSITFDGDLAKLNDYSFGLVQFSYGEVFDRAIRDQVITKIEYVPEMEQNMLKFFYRRFDILPSDRWVAYYYYSRLTSKNPMGMEMKELTPPVDTFSAYIGFSKARDLGAIREQVDATLREMKEDGTYQRILDEHLTSWKVKPGQQ